MTDHVYDAEVRELDYSRRLAEQMIDARLGQIAAAIDARGEGTPIMTLNTLSWPRSVA